MKLVVWNLDNGRGAKKEGHANCHQKRPSESPKLPGIALGLLRGSREDPTPTRANLAPNYYSSSLVGGN